MISWAELSSQSPLLDSTRLLARDLFSSPCWDRGDIEDVTFWSCRFKDGVYGPPLQIIFITYESTDKIRLSVDAIWNGNDSQWIYRYDEVMFIEAICCRRYHLQKLEAGRCV